MSSLRKARLPNSDNVETCLRSLCASEGGTLVSRRKLDKRLLPAAGSNVESPRGLPSWQTDLRVRGSVAADRPHLAIGRGSRGSTFT